MNPVKKVTEKALIARINRNLAREGKVVRTVRGQSALARLGRHYTVALEGGRIVDRFVDLAALTQRLGVLEEGERALIMSGQGAFHEVHADGTEVFGSANGAIAFPPLKNEDP